MGRGGGGREGGREYYLRFKVQTDDIIQLKNRNGRGSRQIQSNKLKSRALSLTKATLHWQNAEQSCGTHRGTGLRQLGRTA